jgi:hypothetical protein
MYIIKTNCCSSLLKDSPPIIKQVQVIFTPVSDTLNDIFTYNVIPQCTEEFCEVKNLSALYYHQYNVQVSQMYSDGSTSATATWGWPGRNFQRNF